MHLLRGRAFGDCRAQCGRLGPHVTRRRDSQPQVASATATPQNAAPSPATMLAATLSSA